MEEKQKVEIEFVSDKLNSLKQALFHLSNAEKFSLVAYDKDGMIYNILNCDNGKENDVLKETIAIQYQLLQEING